MFHMNDSKYYPGYYYETGILYIKRMHNPQH